MPTNYSARPAAANALAGYLDKRIYELRGVKTQREIAAAAGFPRPNILSMFKTGETRVPFERIAALARALDADPAHMFRLGMIDSWPDLAHVIDDIFGKQMASRNETDILLTKWRSATADADPAPNAGIDAAVDAMLAEIVKLL